MLIRSRFLFAALALAATMAAPEALQAQAFTPEVVRLAAGESFLITRSAPLTKISIADPGVADVVVVSSTELVVNGKVAGTTSLMLWDNAGGRAHYSVKVNADAESLQENLRRLFPDETFRVEASGGTVVLAGDVSSSMVSERMEAVAATSVGEGATVSNQLSVPDPGQILLQVRFAEVSKTALEKAGVNLLRWKPGEVSGGWSSGRPALGGGGSVGLPPSGDVTASLSDAINLWLLSPNGDVGVFIQALKSNGVFRSLAEPNLLAVHGQEASFLAGGEFPYPVVQGGSNVGAVTIQFREYGVRLNFKPEILPSGNIRLHVAPEVSTLDFANGLTLQGFNIPSILSRKAETEVELADGQTFAIAGLVDNSMIQDIDKIPLLGDIPILGSLFRSKEIRNNRSELLVLVTPHIVQPLNERPPVPTHEPDTWDWMGGMETAPSLDMEDIVTDEN
ncbi:MAG: type II and III secretion system protein family protein [Gemmatimonadetes bacterium]|nr:type II and III secretion system protein family protein [Gemmatimonadota bacterium]